MSKYAIHFDFRRYEKFALPLNRPLLPLINAYLAMSFKRTRPTPGVRQTAMRIPGYRGETIGLTVLEPEDIGTHAPCLVYFHGGAFVFKASYIHKRTACEYALQTPCKVILADYRLAPGHAFPVGAEDCYAAFEWVCQNADGLGIDNNRIALGGDSAGGTLAIAVSMMARDRKSAMPCFQMLIYPVTDARQATESIRKYVDTPLWNARLNGKMWKLYLNRGLQGCRDYASPSEAAVLDHLPRTYVEVCEFDCLRDEGVDFAGRLAQCGIPVELCETAGTVHGFEIAAESEIVRQCMESRIGALKKNFMGHK